MKNGTPLFGISLGKDFELCGIIYQKLLSRFSKVKEEIESLWQEQAESNIAADAQPIRTLR